MNKMLHVIDADTLVMRSAALCQNNYDVIHKESGQVFTSVTSMKEFKDKLPPEQLENYSFVPNITPAVPRTGECPSVIGKHALRLQIDKILNDSKKYIEDYRIVLHGEGNFRYDIATITPYKGKRKEKPIFFQKIKAWAFKEYKEKLVIAYDEEADDVCVQWAFKEYQRVGEKKKDWKVCLSHIDKDLNQMNGYHHNFDTNEYYWVSRTEAAYSFCFQMLMGDASDNILGLVDLPKEAKATFGLKGRGIGEKAAERLLEGCETPKDMLSRVVECYELQYEKDWYKVMEENCRLLYLRKLPNEVYDLGDRLTRMGISYER